MSEVESLMERAVRATAEGRPRDAVALADRAVSLAEHPDRRFEALLHRARAEHANGEPQAALDTYWEARNLTKRHRTGRSGEADLGIGMVLLELRRTGEGLEAIRRAARQFRKAGQPFLRGCAETLLADEALRTGDLGAADRHLEVAADLLATSADARLLASALTLRAEVLARKGRRAAAGLQLARAEAVARGVHDARIAEELRGRRREVRGLLTAGDEEE